MTRIDEEITEMVRAENNPMPNNESKTPEFDKAVQDWTGCINAGMTARVLAPNIIEYARVLAEENKKLKEELEKLKPDPVRSYFCACPDCEPVMCCNGQECGCQGLPIDFKPTDKCGNYCLNRVYQENHQLKSQLAELQADKESLITTLKPFADKNNWIVGESSGTCGHAKDGEPILIYDGDCNGSPSFEAQQAITAAMNRTKKGE